MNQENVLVSINILHSYPPASCNNFLRQHFTSNRTTKYFPHPKPITLKQFQQSDKFYLSN